MWLNHTEKQGCGFSEKTSNFMSKFWDFGFFAYNKGCGFFWTHMPSFDSHKVYSWYQAMFPESDKVTSSPFERTTPHFDKTWFLYILYIWAFLTLNYTFLVYFNTKTGVWFFKAYIWLQYLILTKCTWHNGCGFLKVMKWSQTSIM